MLDWGLALTIALGIGLGHVLVMLITFVASIIGGRRASA